MQQSWEEASQGLDDGVDRDRKEGRHFGWASGEAEMNLACSSHWVFLKAMAKGEKHKQRVSPRLRHPLDDPAAGDARQPAPPGGPLGLA